MSESVNCDEKETLIDSTKVVSISKVSAVWNQILEGAKVCIWVRSVADVEAAKTALPSISVGSLS